MQSLRLVAARAKHRKYRGRMTYKALAVEVSPLDTLAITPPRVGRDLGVWSPTRQ
jgi:hypothetical protein